MEYTAIALFFVFGCIIGSFLNVVIFRHNTGRNLGGRSKCFSCRRSLGAVDLVPVFSFLMFKGRCRTCKSKVSWQYPAVEILTGILFAAAAFISLPFAAVSFSQFVIRTAFLLVILSVLVIITVYDIRHKIIPDKFVFIFSGLAFVNIFFSFDAQGMLHMVWPPVLYIAAGLILAFPFYLLWLVSGGRWMGLGDAKLALGIGWLLGLGAGATAIIYSFWIGAAASLGIMLLRFLSKEAGEAEGDTESTKTPGLLSFLPRLSMKTEIPFAPFLVLGLLIVLFFGYNMFSIFYI